MSAPAAQAVDFTDPAIDPAHAAFLRARPRRAVLAAVAGAVAPGARVVRTRRLRGGISSAVHRLDLELPGGAVRSVVLRRFDEALRWHDPERLAREVAVLRWLEPTPVPAPEVLVVDDTGELTGGQAVVLACLPGRGIDPPVTPRWAGRLAGALVGIHELDTTYESEPWVHDWTGDGIPAHLAGTPGIDAIWEAIAPHRAALAAEPRRLAHHDFHPGNTLWRRGAVTGIVDWGHGGRGWPSYDAAYCAFDACLCKGPDAGELFLRAYESAAGRQLHPAWRLVAGLRGLPSADSWVVAYQGLGIAVSVRDVRERTAAWFAAAMRAVA